MAIPIASFDDFEEKFAKLKDQRNLFGFFLFDDGPGQAAVEAFADSNFPWLDNLAAASDMFLFVFLRRAMPGEPVSNPGLVVGNLFGITANKLPGIVIFTLANNGTDVGKGVYLPLDPLLFDTDVQRIEDTLRDLFSVIQNCQRNHVGAEEIFDCVGKGIRGIKIEGKTRPVVEYLRDTAMALAVLPRDILRALPKALAENIASWRPSY